MLIATMHMKTDSQNRADLLDTFRAILEPIRVMPGCLSCHFCQDIDDENSFRLMMGWETGEDLSRFMGTREFGALLVATDLLEEQPQIRFHVVANSAGIEAVGRAYNLSAGAGESLHLE
jgi:quinol monooxygenase YgiN